MTNSEITFFGGVKFIRYPHAKTPANRYFKKTRYCKTRKKWFTVLLHRVIWELEHGEIPNGMVVHHKDENVANNHISNLELKSNKGHLSEHRKEQWVVNRSKLIAWHSDKKKKAIAVKKRKIKQVYAANKNTTAVCKGCGNDFLTYSFKQYSFCSSKCYHVSYYKKKKNDAKHKTIDKC